MSATICNVAYFISCVFICSTFGRRSQFQFHLRCHQKWDCTICDKKHSHRRAFEQHCKWVWLFDKWRYPCTLSELMIIDVGIPPSVSDEIMAFVSSTQRRLPVPIVIRQKLFRRGTSWDYTSLNATILRGTFCDWSLTVSADLFNYTEAFACCN